MVLLLYCRRVSTHDWANMMSIWYSCEQTKRGRGQTKWRWGGGGRGKRGGGGGGGGKVVDIRGKGRRELSYTGYMLLKVAGGKDDKVICPVYCLKG